MIHKSAISRIMTGKRMPTLNEAELLSRVLETPELLDAYKMLQEYKEDGNALSALAFHESIETILRAGSGEELLEQPKIDYGLLYQMIETQYQYCLKQDLSDQIKESFLSKLKKISGFGEMITHLKAMYYCLFSGKEIRLKDRAWLAVALLYFTNPMDMVPDYLLPFGYIDDAMVVGFISYKLSKLLKDFVDQNKLDLQSVE
jgi:uncharacterized membrane protein YkvA (DUF1232 family)